MSKSNKKNGSKKSADKKTFFCEQQEDVRPKLKKKFYEKELQNMQLELVKLQEWIKHQGLKVVVLFEGRDAAGKGGTIKRITQSLNPRVCRVVALGTPLNEKKPNGISNGMYPIYQLLVRWFFLTAVGITARVSNRSWDFAAKMNILSFYEVAQNLNACLFTQASLSSSTGFLLATKNKKSVLNPVLMIPPNVGSLVRWT
ncbi:MAG: hypothetical protein JKX85_09535 [Phycisphaeraceae bacterium]|nr:hypothetical protein [Phycisphaeraceae bacterium]